MSKIIDITDKLSFEEKPGVKIKDTVLFVNNDTPSMMKVMAILEDGSVKASNVQQLVDLLFAPAEQEKLNALKLTFPDFAKLILYTSEIAANGYEEPAGEAATPATT